MSDNPEHLAQIRRQIRQRVKGTNINQETLLATDYLNLFNEAVMMLEMVPDMPAMLDEMKTWQPKAYAEHFRDSVFTDRELAIEAYEASPREYRLPFDGAIKLTEGLIYKAVEDLEAAIAVGESQHLRPIVAAAMEEIGEFLDKASAIIHGGESMLAQDVIDAIIEDD